MKINMDGNINMKNEGNFDENMKKKIIIYVRFSEVMAELKTK